MERSGSRLPRDAKANGKGGRPTKFTVELGDSIVALIRAGNYVETAAAARGVAKSTLYLWLKQGARDSQAGKQTVLASFSDAIEKAGAEAEALDVARLAKHGEKNWQVLAWRLERKHPTRWGRQERVTVEGGEKPLTIRLWRPGDANEEEAPPEGERAP